MEIATLELLEKADFSPSQAKAIAQAIAQEQAKTSPFAYLKNEKAAAKLEKWNS